VSTDVEKILREHSALARDLGAVRDGAAHDLPDRARILIDEALKVSSSIKFVEDRQELRRVLHFWASYLSSCEEPFPDIDIDTDDRRPVSYQARSTLPPAFLGDVQEVRRRLQQFAAQLSRIGKKGYPSSNLMEELIDILPKAVTEIARHQHRTEVDIVSDIIWALEHDIRDYRELMNSKLTLRKFGELEGRLQALRQVIVVADHIQEPSAALKKSVVKNFRRGVSYSFLISHSYAEEEVENIKKHFTSLAGGVKDKPLDISRLIQAQKLGYEWNDVPYVFYRLHGSKSGGTWRDTEILAFRGSDPKKGIANEYLPLPPEFAKTIAIALVSDAPTPIPLIDEKFANPSKVMAPFMEPQMPESSQRTPSHRRSHYTNRGRERSR